MMATLSMNEDQVADEIEKIHSEYASTIQYNDENSLSSGITIEDFISNREAKLSYSEAVFPELLNYLQ